jgi:TRAP-type C4-dicarboxylate transport system permease small subunit
MRLEKKRDSELAERKGLAVRTIIQTIWLVLSGIIAYVALDWIFSSEQLTYDFFYTSLGIPRSVPEAVIMGVLIILIVLVMQFFLVMGYAIASPQGRQRTGDPSPYSSTYDPMQDDYRH